MDSYRNQPPNLNLPPVNSETDPLVLGHEAVPLIPNEEHLPNPESSPSQVPQVAPILPVVPVSDFSAQTQTLTQNDDSNRTMPTISDDSRDLIAKEWVMRAKRIIEHTKSDPREQSEELNKLKAEYIKERYNLTIKASSQ